MRRVIRMDTLNGFAPINTGNYSIKNKYITERETDCLCATYINTSLVCKCTSFFMMSKQMKDNLAYLHVLAKCKPKVRKALFEHGPADLITCICECSLNLLKGLIPLSPTQKRTLSRYKKHLRILADKKSLDKRKNIFSSKKEGIHFSLHYYRQYSVY